MPRSPTPKSHWPTFIQFVKDELAVGGPDCQLHLLLNAVPANTSEVDKVWLAGCYGAHHCVPSALAVWKGLRVYAAANHDLMKEWLHTHWDTLRYAVRPEMRNHRMIQKRIECLVGFAKYAVSESWRVGDYDAVWNDSINSVPWYGRYMAIKYLELLRRIARPDLELMDMRAKHAWSPRLALAALWPEAATILGDKKANGPEAIALTEEYATLTREQLASHRVHVSYFQLQVLLCNYREYLNGTFYPGAGHDEEMEYIDIVKDALPSVADELYRTRAKIFHHELLGEFGGWHGLRPHKFLEGRVKGKEFGPPLVGPRIVLKGSP